MKKNITEILASEINASQQQVLATITLLDSGDTVPFIARYRKEITGGLDDTQLRLLHNRLNYLRELCDRKETILNSIEEQGKLNDALRLKIETTLLKNELEELYLPYRPKRRTRGQIAIEAGLEPLAELLWENTELSPEIIAAQYLNPEKEITTAKLALDGVKYILMERFAENAEILTLVRNYMRKNAFIISQVIAGQEQNGAKFKDYFEYHEKIAQIPSHRALALFRGRKEGVLRLLLTDQPDLELVTPEHYCETIIANQLKLNLTEDNLATRWKKSIINWTWKVKLALYIETELFTELRERAEVQAVEVFAKNINDLLMSAPAGMKVTMGLDPGIRTGVKVAVIDETGKLLVTDTIYPYTGQLEQSIITLAELCQKYKVELVAIGNGTASRETVQLFQTMKQQYPSVHAQQIVVSEAGASVYSASELAALEFPCLDVSLRGAVSIARRLQDPLAELVKIEPKSIGVGQYQHDLNQSLLSKELDNVVESCVNNVGVDLNTASAPLLMRVAGLNPSIAQNIVLWRDEHGRFNDRRELLDVPRLGKKAYQQCAGFLRISAGNNPLDSSGVHPETYTIVNKILDNTQLSIQQLIGNSELLIKLNPVDYVDEFFGLPTITDILNELDKPGRDPRPEFKTAQFSENILNIEDLSQGMIMEGVVTNVTNFGAFVDIGVHQDGLVHISALSDKFVKNVQDIIKAGDIIKVRVLDVDVSRKRIALSTQLKDNLVEHNKPKNNDVIIAKKTNNPPSKTGAFGEVLLAAFKKGR